MTGGGRPEGPEAEEAAVKVAECAGPVAAAVVSGEGVSGEPAAAG